MHWEHISEGVERALVSGDPNSIGLPFVIRFRTTLDIRVPPHWHPEDENIAVLEGPYALGYGDRFDALTLANFRVGSSVFEPKGVRHFASYGPGTVVEVTGIGPFEIFYVEQMR